MKLDKIDQQILTLLQKQGRMTNAKLSKQVGLSAASALERVKKLERAGVINGYHAGVDYSAVGIGLVVLVEVTLARHRQDAVKQFIEAVQPVEQILDCHHVSGKADFLLHVVAKDIAHYEDFILETLSALPGLQHIESMVVLSTVKQSDAVPLYVEP
ncbi:MAG: Lrp/AsnC family transcriptional regulator [Candidatus Marinimicrobia bacterium]|nr:Lrp/AsnC family transcriptional regulator [Candidatus Neomarinimicrobiota bacterium]